MKHVLMVAAVTALVPAAFAQSGGMKGMEMKDMPIPSMKWSAMTMTFKAKDKAMLKKIKPGAKVEFTFEQSGKDYVVTDIK